MKIKLKSGARFLLYTVLEFVIVAALGIGLVYYGPFSNIKHMVVTTAMTTLRHQYLATWFLKSDEINNIMESNKIDSDGKYSNEDAILAFKPAVDEDKIELIDISSDKIKGYILVVSNPARVIVGTTNKLGNVGMKLDEMVKSYNAVGGINAGGFMDEGGHGSGGTPQGLIIENYKVVSGNYSESYDLIGFNNENKLILGKYTLREAQEKRIRDAVTFDPFLIVNGEPLIKQGYGGSGLHPRTVIGQRKDGAVLMMVIDGRQLSSVGATLKEASDIMLKYGAYNAANLDGGASTTMYYNGKIINSPSSQYGPRYLPSAFLIKPIS